jgi:hypothetical protein
MAFTTGDVLSRARIILNDGTSVRWPLAELLEWINDCTRQVAIDAPEAISRTGVISLAAGVLQSLPAEGMSLLRVNCNVTGTAPNWVRGLAITPISRTVLDVQIPGWNQTATVPYQDRVAHVIEDDAVHKTFQVFPGNTGAGLIEVVIAERPTALTVPGSPTLIASYVTTIGLDDAYLPAVVDYVVSRALQKDAALPGAAQRAVVHYQQFQAAFGIRQANEQRVNTKTAE